MAQLGSLELILTGDGTQIKQELDRIRAEGADAGSFLTKIFDSQAISAVGFRLIAGTISGVAGDLDELNDEFTLTDSLVKNLQGSVGELADIAVLRFGQIAQFLGDDLFDGPLASLQNASLERTGLGQLEGVYTLLTAGAKAAKIFEFAMGGVNAAFQQVDQIIGNFITKVKGVADFFNNIATAAKAGSTILIAAVNSIDTAIDDLLIGLSETNPAIAQIRNAAKALGLEFSVGNSFLGKYIQDLNNVEAAAGGIGGAAGQVASGAEKMQGAFNQAGTAVNNFGKDISAQRKEAQLFQKGVEDLADAAFLFDSWMQIGDSIEFLTGSIEEGFNAAAAAASVDARLRLTSTAAQGASEDVAFLSGLVKDFGLADYDFQTTEAFIKLQSAAKGTALEGEQIKEIFAGVAQSAAVMRLSANQTSGVLLALEQIISKGTVQAEELRGQLGERLPGAFQIAARSMGVTTAELSKLLETGQITADEFLPKFAAQLQAESASGLFEAANSGEAALNRLNNSIANFQAVAGQAWLDFGVPALNTLAAAIQFAADKEEYFSTIIDTFAVVAFGKAASAALAFAIALKSGSASTSILGKQITVTTAAIKAYAVQAGLAYAATILLYRNIERAEDAGEKFRTQLQGLNKTLAALKSSADGTELNVVPDKPVPIDFLDDIFTRLNDFESEGQSVATKIGKGFALAAVGGPISLINRSVNFLRTGSFDFVSASEKAANDIIAAVGDLNARSQQILGDAMDFRLGGRGDEVIGELASVDNALKNLEQRKLEIDPGNQEAVNALLKEEQDLLQRRAALQGEIQAQQTAVNSALDAQRQALQNLDPNQLGAEDYEAQKTQIQAVITLLEREANGYNELATAAQGAAVTISASFTQQSAELDIALAQQQASIEEAVTAGAITEEEGQRRGLEAQRKYLADRLKLQQDNLAQLKTALEDDAQLRAVDPTAAGLLTPEQISQYQQQVLQLETDTANTRIELAQTVREAQQEVNQDLLGDLEAANQEAENAIAQSQQSQIIEVKKLQRDRVISAEEAEARISQIETQGASDRLAAIATQIAEVQKLRQSGQITEEEAIAELSRLEQERGDLNLEQVEREIQAQEDLKQAALDALDARSQALQTRSEVGTTRLDIQSSTLDSESALLDARNNLLTAQSELRQQNLSEAIALAEAEGNTNQVYTLRRQLAGEQQSLLQQQNEIARRQLDITQEQREIDLDRQELLADIAIIEAEIAILRAKEEGASAAQIAGLEEILGLRQEQRDAIEEARAANEELNELEDEAQEANEKLAESKASQAESMQSQVDAAKELQEIENRTKNAQNQAAVDSAQAEFDENPSVRNLQKLQDARQKALDDEFAQRQQALDAENAAAIGNAEAKAQAEIDAFREARTELAQETIAAQSDGVVSAEEQKNLDLLKEQNTEAERRVGIANKQLQQQRQIAKAKQDELNTERKAAQEAEERKRKQEQAELRSQGLLSGLQGQDIATANKARNALRAITDQVAKFGAGRQFQELFNFARRDNEFTSRAGNLNEIFLNQLGGLGKAALNLDAIAKGGQQQLAQDLVKQLDKAQALGDNDFLNKLLAKVEELARAASAPKNINVYGATGESGQVIRELQRAESGARF